MVNYHKSKNQTLLYLKAVSKWSLLPNVAFTSKLDFVLLSHWTRIPTSAAGSLAAARTEIQIFLNYSSESNCLSSPLICCFCDIVLFLISFFLFLWCLCSKFLICPLLPPSANVNVCHCHPHRTPLLRGPSSLQPPSQTLSPFISVRRCSNLVWSWYLALRLGQQSGGSTIPLSFRWSVSPHMFSWGSPATRELNVSFDKNCCCRYPWCLWHRQFVVVELQPQSCPALVTSLSVCLAADSCSPYPLRS